MNRYKKYKDSGVEWIGEIPRHWEISKFKYDTVKPVQYGLNISSDKYKDEGIRFIRITDLTEEGTLILEDGKYLDSSEVPDEFILEQNDLLLCRSGHTVGKSYLHIQEGQYTSGGYLVRFNFGSVLKSKFIFFLTKTNFYWDWIKLNTVVSTIENVNGDKYQNLVYPKPPLSEQEQIVSFLDEKTSQIDKMIQITETKIDLLKQKRVSLINEAVTKGLDKTVKMKDSGVEWIGEIPRHWEVIRLRYLCHVSTGNRDTQDRIEDGIYPFFVRSPIIERINSYSFEGESVLTVGDGVGTGKVFHYYNGKLEYHQRVYLFSKFNKILGKFFFLFMKEKFINVTEDQNSKSTVDSLRRPLIDNFQFVIPPLPEQEQIVKYLDTKTSEIDQLVSIEQKRIETLKEYRQSLISEVVTGKVKVCDNEVA